MSAIRLNENLERACQEYFEKFGFHYNVHADLCMEPDLKAAIIRKRIQDNNPERPFSYDDGFIY